MVVLTNKDFKKSLVNVLVNILIFYCIPQGFF